VLEGGDTGQFDPATAGHLSTCARKGRGGAEDRCGWARALSTLLGPEGTTLGRPCAGARGLADDPWSAGGCLSSVVVARHGLGSTSAAPVCVGVVLGVSRGVVGWLWVENCIVDASILFSVVFCVCG
jgi:hypothetical protein